MERRFDVHVVRLTGSAEREFSALAGEEKQQIQTLLSSLEDTPFPAEVIKLDPPDAYAQVCASLYITYTVIADDVIVCSIKSLPSD